MGDANSREGTTLARVGLVSQKQIVTRRRIIFTRFAAEFHPLNYFATPLVSRGYGFHFAPNTRLCVCVCVCVYSFGGRGTAGLFSRLSRDFGENDSIFVLTCAARRLSVVSIFSSVSLSLPPPLCLYSPPLLVRAFPRDFFANVTLHSI